MHQEIIKEGDYGSSKIKGAHPIAESAPFFELILRKVLRRLILPQECGFFVLARPSKERAEA
jgi:hypothetical protein